MAPSVAVVGATGAVGDLMRRVLAERDFPVRSIKFLASESSAGKTVEFAGQTVPRRAAPPRGVRRRADRPVAARRRRSARSSPRSPRRAGAIVVDNSCAWRMDPDCPLVVPEVNADAAAPHQEGDRRQPELLAIPLCVALKPLHDLARIRRIVVATYQASSRQGGEGAGRLRRAAGGRRPRASRSRRDRATRPSSPATSSPLDWTLDPNGYTEEENKVVNETQKILGDATIGVCPTCVRVPVRVAHSEAITVEFQRPSPSSRPAKALRRGARAWC